MRRAAPFALIALLVALVGAPPVSAGGFDDGNTDGSATVGQEATAAGRPGVSGEPESSGPSSSGTASPGSSGTSVESAPAGTALPPLPVVTAGVDAACAGATGCPTAPGAPQPVRPSAGELAEMAYAELTITFPGIETSPAADAMSWVQVPVWLWVPESSWRSLSSSSSSGSTTVTVSAQPVEVRWDMGDGASVVCDGPGAPYDLDMEEAEQSTDCSHTYTETSASEPGERYGVTAEMEWRASWEASTGESGVFPPVVVVGRTELRVGQIQALGGK